MRVLFAGTPEVALPALNALVNSSHEVLAVLTRPDAPVGRKRRLTPSPVKARAEELGLPVLTPATLRDPEAQREIAELQVDAAAVVAYGNLVPRAALDIPTHGWVNLHFSLLPQWRGAAPAQRALLAGQEHTGMTVFRLDEGLDTGEVIATAPTQIGPLETSGQLLDRMAQDGAPLLVQVMDALEAGTATFTAQDEAGASHAAKLSPAEAEIDLTAPAEQVSAQIRGMSPAPGAWTTLHGERFKILSVEEAPEHAPLPPGRLLATKKHLLMGTGTTPLALGMVAPAGKKAMRGADWARGALRDDSTTLGEQPQASAAAEKKEQQA